MAEQFLADHLQRYPKQKFHFSEDAREALLNHSWPGNVRELKNCIERAAILTNGPSIEPVDLFENLPGNQSTVANLQSQHLAVHLQDAERLWITRTLEQNDWQINLSAQALGISRKSLWEKMKKLSITRPKD